MPDVIVPTLDRFEFIIFELSDVPVRVAAVTLDGIVAVPPSAICTPLIVNAGLAKYWLAIGVPFHVPVVIVPTLVKLDPTTLLAKVLPVIEDAAVVPVGITTDPPTGIKLPLILMPPPELIVNVFVCEFVVSVTFDPAATFSVSDKVDAITLFCPVTAIFEKPGVAGNVLTILA